MIQLSLFKSLYSLTQNFLSFFLNYLINFSFIFLLATKALLQAHCKLNPHVFPVTSTTSQIKYSQEIFFACI